MMYLNRTQVMFLLNRTRNRLTTYPSGELPIALKSNDLIITRYVNYTMVNLDQIIAFADSAHGEQLRKYSPERYIVHPVRVMETCRKYTDNVIVLSAAILHDVLEDTPVKKEEIRNFLNGILKPNQADNTIRLVEELTDVYTKSKYPNLNRRARKTRELDRMKKISPDAQTIKYADILDNCVEIAERDPEFATVYLRESRNILKYLTKGDSELRAEVVRVLDKLLKGEGGGEG